MNNFNKITALIIIAGFTFPSDVFAGRLKWGPHTQQKETESQQTVNRKPNFNPFQQKQGTVTGIQKRNFTRNGNTPVDQRQRMVTPTATTQSSSPIDQNNTVSRRGRFSPIYRPTGKAQSAQNQNNNTVGKSVTPRPTAQPLSPIAQNNNTVGTRRASSPTSRSIAKVQPIQNQNNNTVGKSVAHKPATQAPTPVVQNDKAAKGKCGFSPISRSPVNAPLPREKVVSKNPHENILIKASDFPEEQKNFFVEKGMSLDSTYLFTAARIKEDLAELQAAERAGEAPQGLTESVKAVLRSKGYRG